MADEASKTQISSWIFVFLIALLWPVTLPCIARKKLSQKVADSQEEAAYIWIRLAE
ncbi:MAG: hypothetical protein HC886_04195 [Leptolyngbyaceae cyanobacterium SM1_1_3]|nr:hypothetical protein [Leptolyngbyaceae cyanobacterium SM1_1_3]NJN03025.1 hypothetical protein [Leptolyngbyaceae cyanobacterium RM1_1_2]NJO08378.1 hypothetical protein [Leptolyngbyaceae cyanobacterium SL_1_1]